MVHVQLVFVENICKRIWSRPFSELGLQKSSTCHNIFFFFKIFIVFSTILIKGLLEFLFSDFKHKTNLKVLNLTI